MTNLDSPHWSYLHGCRKHQGQAAPCKKCVAARDPDITQDGAKAFVDLSGPADSREDEYWQEFYRQIEVDVARNSG